MDELTRASIVARVLLACMQAYSYSVHALWHCRPTDRTRVESVCEEVSRKKRRGRRASKAVWSALAVGPSSIVLVEGGLGR